MKHQRRFPTIANLQKKCGLGDEEMKKLWDEVMSNLLELKNIIGLRGSSKGKDIWELWLDEYISNGIGLRYWGPSAAGKWDITVQRKKVYGFMHELVTYVGGILRRRPPIRIYMLDQERSNKLPQLPMSTADDENSSYKADGVVFRIRNDEEPSTSDTAKYLLRGQEEPASLAAANVATEVSSPKQELPKSAVTAPKDCFQEQEPYASVSVAAADDSYHEQGLCPSIAAATSPYSHKGASDHEKNSDNLIVPRFDMEDHIMEDFDSLTVPKPGTEEHTADPTEIHSDDTIDEFTGNYDIEESGWPPRYFNPISRLPWPIRASISENEHSAEVKRLMKGAQVLVNPVEVPAQSDAYREWLDFVSKNDYYSWSWPELRQDLE